MVPAKHFQKDKSRRRVLVESELRQYPVPGHRHLERQQSGDPVYADVT